MTVKEQIANIIFNGWCDGAFAIKRKEPKEVQQAIDDIGNHFQASKEDQIRVEETIMAAFSVDERNAFLQGFYLCLGLLCGKIMEE